MPYFETCFVWDKISIHVDLGYRPPYFQGHDVMMQNSGEKDIEHYRLIDLKQLSAQLSLSVPTLRNLIKIGMPHYRIARKILLNPVEVFQWLEINFQRSQPRIDRDLNTIIDHVLEEFDSQSS